MKKRYQLSLDEEKAEELKDLIKKLGLPSSAFSGMVNEALPGMIQMFQKIYEKKQSGDQMTMEDLFSATLVTLGEQVGQSKK